MGRAVRSARPPAEVLLSSPPGSMRGFAIECTRLEWEVCQMCRSTFPTRSHTPSSARQASQRPVPWPPPRCCRRGCSCDEGKADVGSSVADRAFLSSGWHAWQDAAWGTTASSVCAWRAWQRGTPPDSPHDALEDANEGGVLDVQALQSQARRPRQRPVPLVHVLDLAQGCRVGGVSYTGVRRQEPKPEMRPCCRFLSTVSGGGCMGTCSESSTRAYAHPPTLRLAMGRKVIGGTRCSLAYWMHFMPTSSARDAAGEGGGAGVWRFHLSTRSQRRPPPRP